MLSRTHKIIFSLVLALCICNSVVATISAIIADEPVSFGKVLSAYVPTAFFIGFYFLVIKKRARG